MYLYFDEHLRLLGAEFLELLPKGSFARLTWRQTGFELHERLVDWPDETDTEYSRHFPVSALYDLVRSGWLLDPEWLRQEDGTFLDEQRNVVPENVTPQYSSPELLAAYGLWLIASEIYSIGPLVDIDEDEEKRLYDEQGFKAYEVIEHRAACVSLAYQALMYARRLVDGESDKNIEGRTPPSSYHSALGKKGADKAHATRRKLREWAIARYQAQRWNSPNQAAHSLTEEVMAYGRTINAHLMPSNAQRTLAEWFRRHDRECLSSGQPDTPSR